MGKVAKTNRNFVFCGRGVHYFIWRKLKFEHKIILIIINAPMCVRYRIISDSERQMVGL